MYFFGENLPNHHILDKLDSHELKYVKIIKIKIINICINKSSLKIKDVHYMKRV